MSLRFEVISPSELTDAQLERWRALQQTSPPLAGPYFAPEFTQTVAEVRPDVRVGIVRDGNEIVAFFPFQRGKLGIADPVGGRLSDFHGLIAAPTFACDATTLLAEFELAGFEFHHQLADQPTFQSCHAEVDGSHYIDLTRGFAGYEADLKAAGSHLMRDFRAKCRKLEREFGKVEFEPHSPDPEVLEQLFAWKSAQYQGAGLIDVFSFDWTRALLRKIHALQTPHFAGMLSVLRVDGRLAAVHMGMRSETVWNWWFPRHDQQFAKGSPGLLLRLFAAQHAEHVGVRRIDLGLGGNDTYKPRLSTGTIPLATGRAERRTLGMRLLKIVEGTEAWVRRSPLLPIARVPGRWLKRLQRRLRFQ